VRLDHLLLFPEATSNTPEIEEVVEEIFSGEISHTQKVRKISQRAGSSYILPPTH
jgi:hypothetical protein